MQSGVVHGNVAGQAYIAGVAMQPYPRALTQQERALLDFILGHDWEGADQVRELLHDTQATGTCACGCGSLDLSVKPLREALRSPSPVPAEGFADDVDGVAVNVMLFIDSEGGYLEFVWYGDDNLFTWSGSVRRPPRLPHAHELRTSY